MNWQEIVEFQKLLLKFELQEITVVTYTWHLRCDAILNFPLHFYETKGTTDPDRQTSYGGTLDTAQCSMYNSQITRIRIAFRGCNILWVFITLSQTFFSERSEPDAWRTEFTKRVNTLKLTRGWQVGETFLWQIGCKKMRMRFPAAHSCTVR